MLKRCNTYKVTQCIQSHKSSCHMTKLLHNRAYPFAKLRLSFRHSTDYIRCAYRRCGWGHHIGEKGRSNTKVYYSSGGGYFDSYPAFSLFLPATTTAYCMMCWRLPRAYLSMAGTLLAGPMPHLLSGGGPSDSVVIGNSLGLVFAIELTK